MPEAWLVEVGLSPAPRGMLAVGSVWALGVVFLVNGESRRSARGHIAGAALPHQPAEPRVGSRETPVDLAVDRPQKKAKAGIKRKPEASAVRPEEGTTRRVARDFVQGEAGPSRGAAGKAPREPSIRDLCRLPAGALGEIYLSRAVGGLSKGQPSDPLVARWEGLTRGDRVWADGEVAVAFSRGGLHTNIARELYVLPSDVLLSRSAKSLLWGHHYATVLTDRVRDAGRALGILIDRNIELRRQIEEVCAGAAPEAVAVAEQRASDLEAEVTWLKSEVSVAVQCASNSEAEGTRLQARVKVAEEQNKDLQTLLRTTRTEVRLANKEVVSLAQKLEEARAEARRAFEALAVETQQRPEKDKKLIEDYKESSGFQLGLVRSGQVTYEYGRGSGPTRLGSGPDDGRSPGGGVSGLRGLGSVQPWGWIAVSSGEGLLALAPAHRSGRGARPDPSYATLKLVEWRRVVLRVLPSRLELWGIYR
ncbi:hypothetical protein C4D60_Mb01t25990 [Musa balbisiana]|uniref:Uncharacterized protein n=1 Tax=Musa balbisiana TaxID=52838 RepID=A0A4S8JQS0_MUSBA|nr:hypothetical protein C4D60_Mb01t25990 [Musa balbisiana]